MGSTGLVAPLVRERETYRYLDLSCIHGYVENTKDPIPPAHPSRDSTLTALTQLSLLRLGAHRAFVSLFDRRYQYVIAETTTSSGLRSSASKPTEEGLLLCGLAFPHAQGVSSHALKVASDSLAASENNSDWRVPVVVVPDVQADERFASSHLLKIYQDVRFYAAVPIRSPAGAFIGVLSTTDSTPRETLGAVEVDFLQDMSLTIMDHLTMIRHRQEEARGKRMMRGLGSFVEGRATMNGLGSDKWSTQPVGDTGQEGMLNVAQQTKMQEEVQRLNIENIATPRNQELTQSYFESESSPHPETPTASGAERQAPVETDIPRRFSGKSTSTVGTTSPESSTRDIRGLFSRAANTIRESIQVEGVLFFDASVATFGGMVESGRNESSDTPHSNTSQESSSGEEGVRSVTSGKHAALNSTKMCEILGFSTTETASVDGDKPNAVHLAVPERFLRLLLRRYPKGKIFNFDENGIPLSDTSESDSDHDDSARSVTTTTASESSHSRHQHKQSFTRSREPSFIIKVFPNARSVLAFPLWDSHKSRWYAGGVVWTRTPTRVFSVRGELSYLRAFGATIMAEMGKIDAEQANQAKGDVLGSISHELRSPLHGILGGVELLLETSMDVFQDSTVNTIERCGVTLLDTVDHLLDFAKINNLMQASKATRRTRLREGGAPSSNKMERSSTASAWDVDVDAIAEEVVSSIFAGHEFETSRESLDIPRADLRSSDHDVRVSDAGMPSKSPPSTSREMPHDHVKVIFDISPATSWRYSTQVGALRRIVMNVFGNALKYTVAGHIRVHVEQKDLPAKGKDMSEVKITVEDTGKGISKEYLAHHLFTPFSQEDSFSPGTGLGLSITHKIVTSLGGTIDAQSKIGKGSTLTISLPLRHSSSTEQSREKKAFTDLTKRTQGVRVSLSGFDENVTPSVQGISTDFKGWQLFRTAIAHQCQDWLQMDVLPSTETAIKPDIYVATPTGARELADMNQAGVVSQPIVVICPNAAVARHLSTTSKTVDRNGIVEYVSQPCGPRKLAKTLTLALDRWADIQVERAGRNSGQTPGAPFIPLPAHMQEQPREADRSFTTQNDTTTSVLPSRSTSLPQLTSRPNHIEHQPQPRQPTSLSNSTPPSSSPPPTSSNIAPYLVVDDNTINRNLLTAYLRKQNLPFATATDGALAVASYEAARGEFSCIFMDIQMPRLDGVAATRAIREFEARERLRPVHIVVLTGLATTQNIQDAKASGANEFFPKPVRLKALDPILALARRTLKGEGG